MLESPVRRRVACSSSSSRSSRSFRRSFRRSFSSRTTTRSRIKASSAARATAPAAPPPRRRRRFPPTYPRPGLKGPAATPAPKSEKGRRDVPQREEDEPRPRTSRVADPPRARTRARKIRTARRMARRMARPRRVRLSRIESRDAERRRRRERESPPPHPPSALGRSSGSSSPNASARFSTRRRGEEIRRVRPSFRVGVETPFEQDSEIPERRRDGRVPPLQNFGEQRPLGWTLGTDACPSSSRTARRPTTTRPSCGYTVCSRTVPGEIKRRADERAREIGVRRHHLRDA